MGRTIGYKGKWVTFLASMFNGIQDYVEHPDKETATRYFEAHYRDYFQIAPAIQVKLPLAYGFPYRKFCGLSLRRFQKIMSEVRREKEWQEQ